MIMDIKDVRKVIENLQTRPYICSENTIELDNGYVIVKKEYFKECQEEMEKLRAKKPVKDKYGHNCCPNCGWVILLNEYYLNEDARYVPHCENCGQSIDWGDTYCVTSTPEQKTENVMKAKLIDAYSLLEVIRESREKNPHCDSKIRANHTIEHDHIAHKVLEQPAAYDVDKVVTHINEIGKRYCDSVKCDKNCADCEHGCLIKAITDAVRDGLNVNG